MKRILRFDFTSFIPKAIIFALCALFTLIFSSDKKKATAKAKKSPNFLQKTKRRAGFVNEILTAFYLHELKKQTAAEQEKFPVKLEQAEIIDI